MQKHSKTKRCPSTYRLFELLKLFVKTAAFYKIKQKKVSKWKFSGMEIKKE
jgi:hypothetical protein